jgi:hypothetical protein
MCVCFLQCGVFFGIRAFRKSSGRLGAISGHPYCEPAFSILIAALVRTVLNVQKHSNDRHHELKREISRIEVGGKQAEAEIRRLINESELQSAQFNARGLPLIAAGTVMTGPAGILAECLPFGWACVAGRIGLMIYGVWPWRDRLLRRSAGGTTVVPNEAEASTPLHPKRQGA